jgi:glucose-6-phosphate 1-dehydrogenase
VLTNCVDLLQVLTIIGMERPISFSAEDIRDEKVGSI